MKTQHTPGQWHSHEAISRIYNKETFEIYRPKEGDTIGYAFNEANGKLIAAAPELLEALIELKNWVGRLEDWKGIDPPTEIVDKAIKKATE